MNTRISELTEAQELEHSRVLSLERTKNQLAGQIQELQSQLDTVSMERPIGWLISEFQISCKLIII